MRVDPRPIAETPLFPDALPALAVQQPLPFDRILTMITDRMDRHDAKLERLQSTQFTVCEQLRDLRLSLPMQRRPLSQWVQRIHVEVLNAKRGGLCPCCEETKVSNEDGRLPGAEYDHWYSRNRARAEETWLVCGGCNQRLNDTEFKASVRSAFESYQLALRRVLQTRQTTLIDVRQSAAS
jgi:predicted  nucleic acid-binding Zn-ribbon protein